jgi:hypothetical protein
VTRTAAFLAALVLLLAWDVATAGRLAERRTAPTAFLLLGGLSGFLVAPALILSVASESALTGRALEGLGWLWPTILVLFSVQAAYALRLRSTSAWVAAPILALNLVLAFIAVVRYAGSLGYDVPVWALTPGLALANLLAFVLGPAGFASPAAVMAPVLAPGQPAHRAIGTWARGCLALLAASVVVIVSITSFPAHAALAAYSQIGTERATEVVAPRRSANLLTGLRILPELTRVPAASAWRDDIELADSLGVDALLVRVKPEGCTPAVLDSLDRALEPLRRDSTLLIVTLAYGRDASRASRASESAFVGRRADDVDRLVRRLRPDYIVPAETPYEAGIAALGTQDLAWWQRFLSVTARAAHRARPATRVVLTSAAEGMADSALYEWAVSNGSPIDAVAFEIMPAIGGARHVSATLAAADRWMRRSGDAREHWLIAAGAPALEGEDAQQRLARHVLLWAATRPQVRGVVLGDAADYDRVTGFRSTSGRFRRVTADVAATIRTLAEPSAPPP